jgi:hypothetical protein
MVGLGKVLGVARTGRAGHVVAGRRDALLVGLCALESYLLWGLL